MPEFVYVVVRTGVYDQGIVGIFASKRGARLALDDAISEERDSYHNFDIRPYAIGYSYLGKYFKDDDRYKIWGTPEIVEPKGTITIVRNKNHEE